jgi:hypothetical protein
VGSRLKDATYLLALVTLFCVALCGCSSYESQMGCRVDLNRPFLGALSVEPQWPRAILRRSSRGIRLVKAILVSYSYLSTTSGSTPIARRAGTAQAASAIPASRVMTPANTNGS